MYRFIGFILLSVLQLGLLAQVSEDADSSEVLSKKYLSALKLGRIKEGYVLLKDSTIIYGAVEPIKLSKNVKVTEKNGMTTYHPFSTVKEFKYGTQTLIIGPRKEFYRAYLKGPKVYLYESIPWNSFWDGYIQATQARAPTVYYLLWKKEGDIMIRTTEEARIELGDCDKAIALLDDKKTRYDNKLLFKTYNYECD